MENIITVSILTENLYEIYAKGHQLRRLFAQLR